MTESTTEAPAAPQTPSEQPPAGAEQEPKTFDADYVAGLRKEAAKYRTEAKAHEERVSELQSAQQQQLDAIARALGLKPDDNPPDPAALTRQVQEEQTRAREAAVQLAVYRTAAKHGGNPDALLDSASFLRAVSDLDPNDSDAVGVAIKAALETNPRLAAATDAHPGVAGIGVGGSGGGPIDPIAADYAQIEADLGRTRRR